MRPIPTQLPSEMWTLENDMRLAPNKEAALKMAYDVLSSRYHGGRLRTYLQFWKLFNSDINKLWPATGFMHCTNINYLMCVLLIKSEWFKPEEVRTHWTLMWGFSPHQYLRVCLSENNYRCIDIWAKPYGIAYGDYAHGRH